MMDENQPHIPSLPKMPYTTKTAKRRKRSGEREKKNKKNRQSFRARDKTRTKEGSETAMLSWAHFCSTGNYYSPSLIHVKLDFQ